MQRRKTQPQRQRLRPELLPQNRSRQGAEIGGNPDGSGRGKIPEVGYPVTRFNSPTHAHEQSGGGDAGGEGGGRRSEDHGGGTRDEEPMLWSQQGSKTCKTTEVQNYMCPSSSARCRKRRSTQWVRNYSDRRIRGSENQRSTISQGFRSTSHASSDHDPARGL